MGLVDIYDVMSKQDVELEKAAAVEFSKLAEEDAAGRIMARGFMDELNKLAEGPVATAQMPKPTKITNTMGTTRPASGSAMGNWALGKRTPFKGPPTGNPSSVTAQTGMRWGTGSTGAPRNMKPETVTAPNKTRKAEAGALKSQILSGNVKRAPIAR